MPQYFHFAAPDVNFNAPLHCDRCTFIKSNGLRCKKNVCIGLNVCSIHLPYQYKVKIATSLIPNSGKGLFAFDVNAPSEDAVVFQANDTICPYNGQMIDKTTLVNRYGQYTAPYGLQTKKDTYEDAAIYRGVGSLINHKPGQSTNAKLAVNPRTGKGVIKATKKIRQGQEIYVNYGRDYQMNEPTRYTTNYKKNFTF